MHKVLVTRKLAPEILTKLSETCELDVWDQDSAIPYDELLKRIVGKDGLLCLLTDNVDAKVIEAGVDTLKTISTMSVGYDHINIEECAERNISVGYTPGVLTDSVADLSVGLMLSLGRRVGEASIAAKNGEWDFWRPYWMTGNDLSHATVGIVGLGRIGATVAKRLRGFDCNVLYTARSAKPDLESQYGMHHTDFDELVKYSDFITIHAPLTPDTKHMFSTEQFGQMKSNAILINTSRGGLVDQDALVTALTNKDILGAALDVTTPEPLPTDHPLFKLSNCLILPHIGSASVATRQKMGKLAAENLLAGLGGTMLPEQVPTVAVH